MQRRLASVPESYTLFSLSILFRPLLIFPVLFLNLNLVYIFHAKKKKKKSERELVVDLILKAFLNVWQRPGLSHIISEYCQENKAPRGESWCLSSTPQSIVGVTWGSLAENRAHTVAGFCGKQLIRTMT